MTGAELRERRKKLGLSQSALAELLGTTQTTIARNEKDENDKLYSPIQNPIMLDLALKTVEREQNAKRK